MTPGGQGGRAGPLPTLFIGSASPALGVARTLAAALTGVADATVWDDGIFAAGGWLLGDLVGLGDRFDFAVLVLTADDVLAGDGGPVAVPRDNLVFESGLFIGLLGVERTLLLTPSDEAVRLPSDLDGLTRLTYHRVATTDGAPAVDLARAADAVGARIVEFGPLDRGGDRSTGEVTGPRPPRPGVPATPTTPAAGPADTRQLLDLELDSLASSLAAQGWTIRSRTPYAFRVAAPDGTRFSLSLGPPGATRLRLRALARAVRDHGTRLPGWLLEPPAN